MARSDRYSAQRRPMRWGVIALLAVLHVVALYAFARMLAPDLTAAVERSVVSAFTVTVTTPDEPIPPENTPQPDEGAQGETGKKAVPKPVAAPSPRVPMKEDTPMPRASSTGSANTSGARDAGDGTGASGSGPGTGSGREGGGMGGVAVTRPVHISGEINSARDYPIPEGGRNARKGSEVIVRMIVGTDGRARNCTIYRPSPFPEADRITCDLVEQRLRFRPAQDARGNLVAAPFYWRQRWF
ncbi:energy transducer TonB [Altererythrobacter sp. GH1-8]|uniref:energy transducer TonB n=1 Tax=Altererythrobacter sp. GH1-8 TaxID=3349333 RepID=UPI00374C8EE0